MVVAKFCSLPYVSVFLHQLTDMGPQKTKLIGEFSITFQSNFN